MRKVKKKQERIKERKKERKKRKKRKRERERENRAIDENQIVIGKYEKNFHRLNLKWFP